MGREKIWRITLGATRQEVYNAIDQERAYQNEKWSTLDKHNNVADFLCYMKRYWDEAVYTNNPDKLLRTLTAIRKLTALGIAVMEKFNTGSPR
jgi:hypothetical protein